MINFYNKNNSLRPSNGVRNIRHIIFFSFVHLVRFNGNGKRHFLTYTLTRVVDFRIYHGTTINNKDKQEL